MENSEDNNLVPLPSAGNVILNLDQESNQILISDTDDDKQSSSLLQPSAESSSGEIHNIHTDLDVKIITESKETDTKESHNREDYLNDDKAQATTQSSSLEEIAHEKVLKSSKNKAQINIEDCDLTLIHNHTKSDLEDITSLKNQCEKNVNTSFEHLTVNEQLAFQLSDWKINIDGQPSNDDIPENNTQYSQNINFENNSENHTKFDKQKQETLIRNFNSGIETLTTINYNTSNENNSASLEKNNEKSKRESISLKNVEINGTQKNESNSSAEKIIEENISITKITPDSDKITGEIQEGFKNNENISNSTLIDYSNHHRSSLNQLNIGNIQLVPKIQTEKDICSDNVVDIKSNNDIQNATENIITTENKDITSNELEVQNNPGIPNEAKRNQDTQYILSNFDRDFVHDHELNRPEIDFKNEIEIVGQENSITVNKFRIYNSRSEEHLFPSNDFDIIKEKLEYNLFLKSFNKGDENRPPIPLQTYRWEDIRRAKQQGGYPWTHLYKQPLGPNEEPGIILKHKTQNSCLLPESPKALKKVQISEDTLLSQVENYNIKIVNIDEKPTAHDSKFIGEEVVKKAVLANVESDRSKRNNEKFKGILKRPRQNKPRKLPKINTNLERINHSEDSPKTSPCCHPLVDKIKGMADKQLIKHNIKKVPLKDNEKIVLNEQQKILQLKISPKAERGEIPHFIEKQDSDEIIEIVELEESPSKARKRRGHLATQQGTSILIPDEIIELPKSETSNTSGQKADEVDFKENQTPESNVSEILEEESKEVKTLAPQKAPRKKKEHVYEDINNDEISKKIDEILEEAAISALKKSLAQQDFGVLKEIEVKARLLDGLGSSEEDQEKSNAHLAPISSVDSTSSEEERKINLSPLIEEMEPKEHNTLSNTIQGDETISCKDKEHIVGSATPELKSSLKREPSPSSDKKVTFSHTDDDTDPHREDVLLPDQYRTVNRWSKMSDHEYEPIGEPINALNIETVRDEYEKDEEKETQESENSSFIIETTSSEDVKTKLLEISHQSDYNQPNKSVNDESYLSSSPTTPRTDSRADEIHTSLMDSSALESLPPKSENRRKSFMASAHDRSRKVQQNLRSQAGKIKTKLSKMKKPVSGSPKIKERKKFRGPDFSKFKLLDIKKPELPKFKTPNMSKFKNPDFGKIEFKRPEFTKFSLPDKAKFNKLDLSKFKIPEKFSSLKLRRSKSLKERNTSLDDSATATTLSPETSSTKKRFDFHFATYPRILRKKKSKISSDIVHNSDELRSTESPTSTESATIPRMRSHKKSPIGSNWADKFSDVSCGDSESGKYQRYDDESENLTNLEKEQPSVLTADEDFNKNPTDLTDVENLRSVEMKQLAAYDEENRAIHEISKIRENEFKKRKPIVHQDSDLVSEESKDFGWTEKDILRHNILARSETADSDHIQDLNNFSLDDRKTESLENTNPDSQSTGSSSALRRKGVIEEIDDDEFFLRKKGISEENIEIREYISTAIREGLGGGQNALAQLGSSSYYADKPNASDEVIDYAYDVPPPKPRRVKPANLDDNSLISEIERDLETESFLKEGDFSLPTQPSRPARKHRSRKKRDEEYIEEDLPYFDEEQINFNRNEEMIIGDEFHLQKDYEEDDERNLQEQRPKAPKRRKKQIGKATEEEIHINGFSENALLDSYIPDENEREIIVYRTQHEYIIPLAQIETFSTPTPTPRRSRSRSRSQTSHLTDDDRTSHGADSLASDAQQIEREIKYNLDMKENNGYAVIRKEPPPRPPAPIRRKRSSNSLEEKHFATMPHIKKGPTSLDASTKLYNTIGPLRPPRKKSTASMGETSNFRNMSICPGNTTQYEELDNDETFRTESPRDLQSGEIINKMKYRPLPPPPRPPRESRKQKEDNEGKLDKDSSGEKYANDLDTSFSCDVGFKSIEVEVSTQTDPLPEDFTCEEFEITDDMRIIEPRRTKTLEDILKEEQEAEMERAKQLAEDEVLSRSIQKFRESNQRSFSEKSKASTADNAKNRTSRPTTPSAILIERRVPTPITSETDETLVEASLTVQPLDSYIETNYNNFPLNKYESDTENEKHGMTDNFNKINFNLGESKTENNLERDEDCGNFSPPNPPPRKRFSMTAEEQFEPQKDTVRLEPEQCPQEHPSKSVLDTTSKITLTDLEVDHLSVNAIEANRIMVSQLQGASISVHDFECKSGNLTVHNMELPPGFIDDIVERIRTSEREYLHTLAQNVQPQDEAPARPPPPQQHSLPSDYVQLSIPPQRHPGEEEFQSVNIHRRRRHHRRRDSSSSDTQKDRRHSRHITRSPEPSIRQLSGQLLSACGATVLRTLNQILNLLNISEKEMNNQNMKVVVIIFILMTLGFLLLGMAGAKNIHHHHWDYFNPPGNEGRN